MDIPEFQGGLQPEEYFDWIVVVEEVLEFKQVPENRRVSLAATRLRGRAGAWWQQLKLTRTIQGKSKIVAWEKIKKHMRAAFLLHNYERLMFQQLQNLKKGNRSIDDYTVEFYQLISRNAIVESDDMRVSRYIGGTRPQF